MAATKYTYSLVNDFPNQKVDIDALTISIRESDITIALDYINSSITECDIWFKDALSASDETSVLTVIVESHDGEAVVEAEPPVMPDGRPLVRADTRPLDSETYFTGAGDEDSIGDGDHLQWDFSDATSNIYVGTEVPDGMKAKVIKLKFTCPVYLKDGTIYFFKAKWNSYIDMDVVVPAGNYYPNPAGAIPASALGLPGDDMYSYASVDTPYQMYVQHHHMFGDCPMGDELNAEGAAVYPVPIGWYVRGLIIVPEDDNESKGFGSLEMYRCHTHLLPGQTLQSIHS